MPPVGQRLATQETTKRMRLAGEILEEACARRVVEFPIVATDDFVNQTCDGLPAVVDNVVACVVRRRCEHAVYRVGWVKIVFGLGIHTEARHQCVEPENKVVRFHGPSVPNGSSLCRRARRAARKPGYVQSRTAQSGCWVDAIFVASTCPLSGASMAFRSNGASAPLLATAWTNP